MADEFLVRLDANTPVIRQDLQLTVDNLFQDVRQGDARQFLEVLYAHGTFGQLVWLAVDLHLNLVVMMVFMVMFMPVVLLSRAFLRQRRFFCFFQFGSQQAAFDAIQQATETAVQQQGISGVFQTTIQVAGQIITVRGNVISGVVKIGTAFK
jgi:hypothetical protein